MSELIPNLDDLRAQLPINKTTEDAHELLVELDKAKSMDEVAATVDALLDRWLEVPDGPRA